MKTTYKNEMFRKLTGWLKGGLVMAAMVSTGSLLHGQALVNNNGALVTVTTGANVVVKTGSIDNNIGKVDNAGTITIEGFYRNGDTSTGGSAAGVYRLTGDWINDGSFIADQSDVELYGANQLITGDSISFFYDLTLTGTGIKTQTLDAFTTNELTLNDRELATVGNKMTVTNTLPAAIARTTGFVSSTGAGRLVRYMNTPAIYLFPVGSSAGVTRYRPLEVTPSTSNAQEYEVRMANVDATTEGYDLNTRENEICDLNDLFFHYVGRSGTSTDPVGLRFFFDPTDGPWSLIGHWQNQPRWESTGTATAGTSGGFNTLAITGWNDFALEPFALGIPEVSIDSLSTLITDATCNGGDDGAIDITVVTGTPNFTYEWSVPAGTEDVTGLEAGTYTLTITDANGCNRDGQPYTFTVEEPDSILLTASIAEGDCFADTLGSIDLTINDAVLPLQGIQWSNTETTEDIAGLQAGTYTVTVTDANGCMKSLDVELTQPGPLNVDVTTVDLTCFGDSTGSILLDVSGGTPGLPPYRYAWSNLDSSENLTGIGAGTYSVTVLDENKCKEEINGIVVYQPDSLSLTASMDDTLLIGYSTEIEVLSTDGGTGIVDYEWTPTEYLDSPFDIITGVTPMDDITYVVTGTDENGCVATDTVVLIVHDNAFVAPDGFTPNGDGLNDRFELITTPSISVGELKIFNRWGQLVSDNPNGWDGTYEGKAQPMDTYVFQTVIIFPDGQKKPYQGDFILIR